MSNWTAKMPSSQRRRGREVERIDSRRSRMRAADSIGRNTQSNRIYTRMSVPADEGNREKSEERMHSPCASVFPNSSFASLFVGVPSFVQHNFICVLTLSPSSGFLLLSLDAHSMFVSVLSNSTPISLNRLCDLEGWKGCDWSIDQRETSKTLEPQERIPRVRKWIEKEFARECGSQHRLTERKRAVYLTASYQCTSQNICEAERRRHVELDSWSSDSWGVTAAGINTEVTASSQCMDQES